MTRSTDITADGASKLISEYHSKPIFKKWLASYTDRLQEAEDLIWDLIEILDINNAVGVWLTLLGGIVGQPRTADDDVYRLYVKARIRINISHGTEDDMQELANLLLVGTDWHTRDVYPNEFRVNVNNSQGAEAEIASLFKECLGAARRLRYEYSEQSRSAVFAFRHYTQPTNPALGFDNGNLAGVKSP